MLEDVLSLLKDVGMVGVKAAVKTLVQELLKHRKKGAAPTNDRDDSNAKN